MATFATEAQRLVALSIGKIASSRSQRGGINLHKNLLVASVLHKARTSYMMENYLAAKKSQHVEPQPVVQQQQQEQQQTPQQQQQLQQQQIVRVEPVKFSTSHAVTQIRQETQMESGSVEEVDSQAVNPLRGEDKENSRANRVTDSMEVSQDNNNSALCEKKMDNNVPEVTHRQEKGVTDFLNQICQKCTVKRRRSFDQENDTSSCPKKAKLNNESDKMEYTQQESQINNLVSIFNSGMSEVCTTGDYVTGDSDKSNKISVFTQVSCQNLKAAMENYSCSVQVKDSLCENIPTVIALTV